MPRHKTPLELDQLLEREVFKDFCLISELRELTHPPLAESTIIQAIDRRRVLAHLFGENSSRGVYLIHLPSARQCWPDRFQKDNQ